MPIKKINKGSSGDSTEKRVQMATKSIHKVMQYAGEDGLKYARENGNFQDRTGNLRSSEGYSVLEDGKMISESKSEKFFDGKEGINIGKSFRNEMAKDHGRGITLLMVAGMPYAGEVEAKGYDVLSSSEFRVKQLVPRLLRKLGFRVS